MSGRVLQAHGVAFCVQRFMTADKARATWYGRCKNAEQAGADFPVARGQNFGIDVKDKEDGDLSDISMELYTGIRWVYEWI